MASTTEDLPRESTGTLRAVIRPRLLTAVLLPIVMLGAACSGGDSAEDSLRSAKRPAAGEASAAQLTWSACESTVASLVGLQCSTLSVPVDHSDPDGGSIELAVARSTATGPATDRIGSLVLNPGGPGVPTIDWLANVTAVMPAELSERFDLVAFDPRGVGESSPVRCLDDETKAEQLDGDLSPSGPADIEQAIEEQEELLDACRTNAGDLIEFMSTADVAADLDVLREALGDEQLTYVGFSYGTSIGAAYATLFPERTRALILDGSVSPRSDVEEEAAAQAAGFERTFESFVVECDADPACALAPDAASTIDDVRASLETEPVEVGDEGRLLGPDQFDFGLATALYDTALWSTVANAIAGVRDGGAATLLALMDQQTGRQPDGTFDNSLDARTMVNCADQADRPTTEEAIDIAQRVSESSPRFGPLTGWAALGCVDWPEPANPLPDPEGDGAPPIIVIGTLGDPATPYEWSQQMADALATGVLVTYEGDGHTALLRGVECIEDVAIAYLVDLEVPADDPRCASQTDQVDFGFDLRDELISQFLDEGLDRALAECVVDGVIDELGRAEFDALVIRNDVDAFTAILTPQVVACQLRG